MTGPALSSEGANHQEPLGYGSLGGVDAGPLHFAERDTGRGTTWLGTPSQPWPGTGAEGQVQEQGKPAVIFPQDTHQASKNLQLKTSYARGSGFVFNGL